MAHPIRLRGLNSVDFIKATACGDIPAGNVFVVSNEPKWSLITNWQAYSAMGLSRDRGASSNRTESYALAKQGLKQN